MAGAKGRSGGPRAGGGRPPSGILEIRRRMQVVVLEIVTPERWATVIEKTLQAAEAGDKDARSFLAPWVQGAEPKEVKLTGDPENPVVFKL